MILTDLEQVRLTELYAKEVLNEVEQKEIAELEEKKAK